MTKYICVWARWDEYLTEDGDAFVTSYEYDRTHHESLAAAQSFAAGGNLRYAYSQGLVKSIEDDSTEDWWEPIYVSEILHYEGYSVIETWLNTDFGWRHYGKT